MSAVARQFCHLCRGELCITDAVRGHLIADHKRSAAEADELIARFEIAQPIPEPEEEPHMYCTAEVQYSRAGQSVDGRAWAPKWR